MCIYIKISSTYKKKRERERGGRRWDLPPQTKNLATPMIIYYAICFGIITYRFCTLEWRMRLWYTKSLAASVITNFCFRLRNNRMRLRGDDCALLGWKIGNPLWFFCTKTVRQINLGFGRRFRCILNYCSEFWCDSEKKNMGDTKGALKTNWVVLALTKSIARVIRNINRKRDS